MDSLTTAHSTPFFDRKTLLTTSLLSAGYLLLSYILVGFKTDQLVLALIFNACFYVSRPTRKFIIAFSVFIVYWIIYDYMKAFPNYTFGDVHIADLYHAEKRVFGIQHGGAVLTPNEYWVLHASKALDVISGFFYLCWIPVPLLFGAFLFFKSRRQYFHFAFTFLLVNLLGFVVYYTYPAAPPWYVELYGFNLHVHTPGNTAGLARFDQFFQVSIFKALYAKGSNVFAAMPSLHSAYPLIVFVHSLKNRLRAFSVISGIITAGIWFAAVYTSHHYVLDVLAGIVCALVGIFIYERFFLRRYFFLRLLQRLNKATV